MGAGHSLESIRHYTLPQLELFGAAIDRADKARMRDGMVIARAAKAKPDKFKQILKELDA